MHIVVIAWLFVIGVMALALSSPLAGFAWFVGAGVLPVWLMAWFALRRRRSRLEGQVEARDDGHAEPDRQHLAQRLGGLGPPVQARNEVGDRDVEQ